MYGETLKLINSFFTELSISTYMWWPGHKFNKTCEKNNLYTTYNILFTSSSEGGNMTSPSSVSPSIILSYSSGPSSRKTSQPTRKLQNVADGNMRLLNVYLPFITSPNGRYSLVTSESHKITLSMNWKLFVDAMCRQCYNAALKVFSVASKKRKILNRTLSYGPAKKGWILDHTSPRLHADI
jgi:hypothetical protein